MNTVERRSKKGFTIAELIIALSILVIISAMVAVIFRATQQSFTNARAFQHVIDLARQTMFRIHNELAAVYKERSGIINFVGVDAMGSHIKANSTAERVSS